MNPEMEQRVVDFVAARSWTKDKMAACGLHAPVALLEIGNISELRW